MEDGSVLAGVAELARRGHLSLASAAKARYPKLSRVKTGPGSQELLDAERVDRATR